MNSSTNFKDAKLIGLSAIALVIAFAGCSNPISELNEGGDGFSPLQEANKKAPRQETYYIDDAPSFLVFVAAVLDDPESIGIMTVSHGQQTVTITISGTPTVGSTQCQQS
jgi:hypothetical protein